MLTTITLIIIVITSLFFLGLGSFALFSPHHAKRFLLAFATSPIKHYLELFIRILVGGSLVIYSSHMLFSNIFNLFGWTIIITTACLLLVPWQWHRRFAQFAVPKALQFLWLIGVSSLSLGVGLLVAVFL